MFVGSFTYMTASSYSSTARPVLAAIRYTDPPGVIWLTEKTRRGDCRGFRMCRNVEDAELPKSQFKATCASLVLEKSVPQIRQFGPLPVQPASSEGDWHCRVDTPWFWSTNAQPSGLFPGPGVLRASKKIHCLPVWLPV